MAKFTFFTTVLKFTKQYEKFDVQVVQRKASMLNIGYFGVQSFSFDCYQIQIIKGRLSMKKLFVIPLLSIGLSMSSMVLASILLPGFDLFETVDETVVDFTPHGGPLVRLTGNSSLLNPKSLGNTDTIVKRKQGIAPFEALDIRTINIELIALSLKSKEPVDVSSMVFTPEAVAAMGIKIYTSPEEWASADLYVTVNSRTLSEKTVDSKAVINLLGISDLPELEEWPQLDKEMRFEELSTQFPQWEDFPDLSKEHPNWEELKDRKIGELFELPKFHNLPQPDELPPSLGTMRITHKNTDSHPSQGEFKSNLKVRADLIAVNADGDIGNQNDL